MTMFEPMDASIVDDGSGSHVEPPFDAEWSRLDSLRWRAGVIRARTGVVVEFNDRHSASGPGYEWVWPELLGVHIRGVGYTSSQSVHDSDIDMFLRGLEAGAEAANRDVKV